MHVGIACLNGIYKVEYVEYVCAELSNVSNVSMHAWHVCMYPSEAGGGVSPSFGRFFYFGEGSTHLTPTYLPTYRIYTTYHRYYIYIYTSYIKKPYIYY